MLPAWETKPQEKKLKWNTENLLEYGNYQNISRKRDHMDPS